MKTPSNHSMQRTGASRFAQLQFERQRRLAPAADAGRWMISRRSNLMPICSGA